jgi:hypothetical protein
VTVFVRIAAFSIAILSTLAFSPHQASGQTSFEPEKWRENPELGGWLGPNFTWFSGADASGESVTSSQRTGFAVAAEARWPLLPWLSAVAGLNFATKGAKYEFRSGRSGGFRSGYLIIPMLAELAPYRSSLWEPYLLAGPELGFMATCDLDDGFTVGDCKDTSKLIDFGAVLGGGVAVAMPWPGRVRLEARYEHGLISIDDTEFEQDYKNRAVLFSIGYSHRLGGPDRH